MRTFPTQTVTRPPHSLRRGVAALSMLLLALPLFAPSAIAQESGTVKISGDQNENETTPENEPHVPCQFAVEFFQFAVDEVQVTFTAQAPSGDETIIILTDTVALEENEEGDEPTYNGQATYDFTGLLDDLERHPEQGYHVMLSVDQSPAEPPLKHKVFWVDCPPDDAADADLTVGKAVTGDDAPPSDTLFEITITCDGNTEVIELADGDTWSWNANVDPDLTEDSTCSIVETDDHDATTVTITFNGTAIDQGSNQDLSEGTNTVTVTNHFDEGAAEADLAVEKAVTGDDAPPSDTLFEITITCDGNTEVIELADGDTWSWNANVDPDLTEDSTCSIVETDDHDATTLTITFNGTAIDQGSNQDLSEGTNTVTVTNDFDDEFIEVGGGEIPGGEDVQAEPDDEVEVLGRSFEQPTSEPEVEVKGVTFERLPRTGTSPGALLLLAVTLIGAGIVTLRRTASGRAR